MKITHPVIIVEQRSTSHKAMTLLRRSRVTIPGELNLKCLVFQIVAAWNLKGSIAWQAREHIIII